MPQQPPRQPTTPDPVAPKPKARWAAGKNLPWETDTELELLRQFCRTDFWTFFQLAFGAASNPKGKRWIEPAVHEPIARWFQHHVDEWLEWRKNGIVEQKHLAILVHREVGKTTMITRAGQLWLHLRDPEMSTYTGAENGKLARKMLAAIKAVLDASDPHALFTKLYGRWDTAARTWAGEEVVHAARRNTARQDPSFGTFSVETSITGSHPDAIFYDDPISLERLKSDVNWFDAVNGQMTSLVPVLQSDGLMVCVGTRYGDGDHFGTAFKDEGIASTTGIETDLLRPEPDGKWHVYFMAGRDRDGKPTTPKVWPEKRLLDYQRRDPMVYATQIMNDPTLSEFNPITTEQIRNCVIDPQQVPWGALRFAIMCDTAFWDGKRRVAKDETVMIVHGYPMNGSGDVYVIEGYGSATWRAEDLGKRLVSTVQRMRRQGRRIIAITDEVTMAGKKDAWKLALQNFFADANEPMPPFFQFDRRGKAKVQRMTAAANFWVDGHVRVVKGAPGVERLMEQMALIGQYQLNDKLRDDWADAHADAFQPEFYHPMRRQPAQRPAWDRGASPLSVEGLDQRLFDDSEYREWSDGNPREPLR